MGNRQTKLEGDCLPQKPTQLTQLGIDYNGFEPRSQQYCESPLNEIVKEKEDIFQQSNPIVLENQIGVFRRRFFKSCSYNLNDPRSPSIFFNRTPLVFDEVCDKTLKLDDTFSDLFVESKVPNKNEPLPLNSEKDGEQNTAKKALHETAYTPKLKLHENVEQDPRSPSVGVDRTPIILNEVEGIDEDRIESILSNISINITHNLPKNKRLDRIKNAKKVPQKLTCVKDNIIYEDNENCTPQKMSFLNSPSVGKRTPLSCVKNHPNLKSRSVELFGKSTNTRLPLMSFDDTLHKITPVKKILRYSNMENIENSFEF